VEVQLVSPEQVLYEGEANMVVVRTLGSGDIAFQDNHAPFLGALADWPLRVKTGTEQEAFAVHGGFVEVSGNRVVILSDIAELASQIDVPRAEAAMARAEEALRANPDDEEAAAAKQRAQTRLDAAGV